MAYAPVICTRLVISKRIVIYVDRMLANTYVIIHRTLSVFQILRRNWSNVISMLKKSIRLRFFLSFFLLSVLPLSGLLILITSAPTHRDARLAIRQTWGHYAARRDIAMAFVLGATNIQSIEDSLEAESYMYSDIIRGRFIDSYNNLTLKTISSLEWVDTYCPRASYVLKTDDDMFINVLRLMAFIDKHRLEERQKIIFGRLAKRYVCVHCLVSTAVQQKINVCSFFRFFYAIDGNPSEINGPNIMCHRSSTFRQYFHSSQLVRRI